MGFRFRRHCPPSTPTSRTPSTPTIPTSRTLKPCCKSLLSFSCWHLFFYSYRSTMLFSKPAKSLLLSKTLGLNLRQFWREATSTDYEFSVSPSYLFVYVFIYIWLVNMLSSLCPYRSSEQLFLKYFVRVFQLFIIKELCTSGWVWARMSVARKLVLLLLVGFFL